MDFETAFSRVIDHEGGFQNDPNDRGNWTGGRVGAGELKGTKYGISAAAYPSLDIRNLTLADARSIYQRDYWRKAGCDDVPPVIRFDVFDTAVNSGVSRAVRFLQAAARVAVDGAYGPATSWAVRNSDPTRLALRFHGERLDFLNDNPELFARYGRGWVQRVAENMKAA